MNTRKYRSSQSPLLLQLLLIIACIAGLAVIGASGVYISQNADLSWAYNKIHTPTPAPVRMTESSAKPAVKAPTQPINTQALFNEQVPVVTTPQPSPTTAVIGPRYSFEVINTVRGIELNAVPGKASPNGNIVRNGDRVESSSLETTRWNDGQIIMVAQNGRDIGWINTHFIYLLSTPVPAKPVAARIEATPAPPKPSAPIQESVKPALVVDSDEVARQIIGRWQSYAGRKCDGLSFEFFRDGNAVWNGLMSGTFKIRDATRLQFTVGTGLLYEFLIRIVVSPTEAPTLIVSHMIQKEQNKPQVPDEPCYYKRISS